MKYQPCHRSWFRGFPGIRKAISSLLVVALLLVMTGCTTTVYNAYVSEDGIDRLKNVRYGPHTRHRLDVYRPDKLTERLPVVVFVHGGSWNSGNKNMYYFVARSLVDRGYVAVLPNYRLIQESKFPAFVNDTARAVAWTVQNINQYGGESRNIFLMGHSAGAYNAAMVAYNEGYLETYNTSNNAVRAFIGLSGLYDFLPMDHEHLRKVFGHVKDKTRTQPIKFVDPQDPEALLMHGTKDVIVDPANSDRMYRALNRRGPGATFYYKHSLNHAYMLLSIGPYFRRNYNTLKQIDDFITDRITTPDTTTRIERVNVTGSK